MTGRPTSYTPEISEEICERYASGEALTSICEDKHMPTMQAVAKWGRTDYPEDDVRHSFRSAYARAREDKAWLWFDEMMTIADAATPDNVQVVRLRVDTRKWALSKLLWKVFGDKTVLAGDDEAPPIKVKLTNFEMAVKIANILGRVDREKRERDAKKAGGAR